MTNEDKEQLFNDNILLAYKIANSYFNNYRIYDRRYKTNSFIRFMENSYKF